jgi:hypothetical protein
MVSGIRLEQIVEHSLRQLPGRVHDEDVLAPDAAAAARSLDDLPTSRIAHVPSADEE